MEVGFIQKVGIFPNFEQVSKPNLDKVQKLTQSDSAFLLKEGAEARSISKVADKVQEKHIKSIKPTAEASKFTEVKLYNSDFGFNDTSKDFFIKVDRGAFVANKYPTDEIMRLKSYLNKIDSQKIA